MVSVDWGPSRPDPPLSASRVGFSTTNLLRLTQSSCPETGSKDHCDVKVSGSEWAPSSSLTDVPAEQRRRTQVESLLSLELFWGFHLPPAQWKHTLIQPLKKQPYLLCFYLQAIGGMCDEAVISRQNVSDLYWIDARLEQSRWCLLWLAWSCEAPLFSELVLSRVFLLAG